MNHTMETAVDFLYNIPKFTTKNGLEHTRMFVERLGNPAVHCKVIHVAGSNGKGSVCSFLYHMLLIGGKSVGFFSSPHLADIRERFLINGALCSREQFLDAFETVKDMAERFVEEGLSHPTFFEFLYAMGLLIFETAGVEYVVMETGLGGRLDCTNSFPSPIMSVITSISLEHTEYLGDTIAAIAGEKAGIIRAHTPVVFDGNEPEAAAVIRQTAEALSCPYQEVSEANTERLKFKGNFIDFSLSTIYDKKTEWTIPFGAPYQVNNAALAITAMRMLGIVDEETIREGLLKTRWPGRMQEIADEVYFDGAHNTGGIEVFLSSVKEMTKEDAYPPLLLFSMVKDKDYRTSAKMLLSEIPWADITVTRIPSERGLDDETLKEVFAEAGRSDVTAYDDYREAYAAMRDRKVEGQKLFCTGSLYFIGALMELLEEEE